MKIPDAAGATPVWLRPVDLDDANIAMQHGRDPSESDPQFHQQMVYAVTMRTLEQFDRALGRVMYFSGRRRLRLVPHAFRGSNAFYHPKLRLLLPGDAEVGAWKTILANPDALALAAGATFLKVGHHGSHNATPITFVREHLAMKTPAVISTQEGEGKYRNGIPLVDLLDAMKARSMPFVRSDKPPASLQGIFKPDPSRRWVDCSIPC